jgi:hypothetical protein
VPVEVREWISPAPASPVHLVLEADRFVADLDGALLISTMSPAAFEEMSRSRNLPDEKAASGILGIQEHTGADQECDHSTDQRNVGRWNAPKLDVHQVDRSDRCEDPTEQRESAGRCGHVDPRSFRYRNVT